MARTDLSLSAAGGAPASGLPLTLAQVRERLDDLPGLSNQKKADLRSALNSVGRALGLPLDAIPASPQMLRDRLERVSPASLGVSKQAWANIRSRLLKALELSGVSVIPSRSIGVYAPEWKALKDKVGDVFVKCALTRFCTFCSVRGIAPSGVTPETFEAFRTSIEIESIRQQQKRAYRKTCLAWNDVRKAIPDWPDVVAPVPDLRDWYALPWSTFPPSLRADIDAMVADATGGDLVTMKARRRIKPQSGVRRVENLHRLISGYVRRGGDPQDLRSLADVVQLDIVREGLRFHLDRSGGKPTVGMRHIIATVCAVARQWVEAPDDLQSSLKRLRQSFATNTYEMAAETRALLRSFDDERRLAALLNAPRKVFSRISGRNRLTCSQAVTASVALAVQILLDAPVRVHNLAMIDLDRHVLRIGSGRTAQVHLHFREDEVKNEREIELPLSEETAALLDSYLDFIRPQLVRAPHSFLFPGAGDNHKVRSLLSKQIAAFVHEHVGIRVTPHKFRHLIGYLYLKQNPGAHEVVRQLLGHKSIETTIRYYAPMEQDEAFRLYDDFLEGLRKQSAGAEPPKRRRK